MINRLFFCEEIGELSIKSNDISYLFNEYKDIYSNIFKIETLNFEKQRDFKVKRGGVVITIFKETNLLGFFSLTKVESNYLEFGDLAKVSKSLPSQTFAYVINFACKEIIYKMSKKGIYTYPNFYASRLLRKSGFILITHYQRNIYVVIFSIRFLLPIVIYKNKIHLNKYIKLKKLIQILNFEIIPTRLSFLNLRIFRKGNRSTFFGNILKFGLLYTYQITKTNGDDFLVFNDNKFPKEKIDFQFTDNSA